MLDEILHATRARIAALASSAPPPGDRRNDVRSLEVALSRPGLQVVAEIKRRSPSAGPLAPGLDPVRQALAYEEGGAAAISVLTEPDFFDGSLEDLAAVRSAVSLPVLRKDFVLDPVQVWEAAAFGADAVLLIVAALDDEALGELLRAVAEAGIEALVETHTAAEVVRALAAGATILGVNNRNLDTFATDLATAEELAPLAASAAVRVAESGVSDPIGAGRMAAAGYDAVLVGEALVRSPDPAQLIASLRSVAP